MDFFTAWTLTGRVLFVVVVLCHYRRQIVHLNTTAHPTAEWAAQQVVEAFPDASAPRWMHRDRDRIYTARPSDAASRAWASSKCPRRRVPARTRTSNA
jgi:hypothetical protein